MQRYYADPNDSFAWPNGAIGYGPKMSKVANCPLWDSNYRLTCYATAEADPVPACTRVHNVYVRGFFSMREDGPVFIPYAQKSLADR